MAATMTDKQVEVARERARIDELEVELTRRKHRLREMERPLPTQPAVGSVIQFSIQFGAHEDVYSYVAIRMPSGGWQGTTDRIRNMSWAKLIAFMCLDVSVLTEVRPLEWTTLQPGEVTRVR